MLSTQDWAHLLQRDLEIRNSALKSLLLNTLCLASIYGFDFILLPILHVRVPLDSNAWLHHNFGRMYQLLWVMPVVGASLYLNVGSIRQYYRSSDRDILGIQGFWCKTIAKRTFQLRRGQMHGSLHVSTPTTYYRGIMITISLVFTTLLGCVLDN